MTHARVGLLLGDACGIGPEIVARLLASDALEPAVATVVIGEPRVLARAQAIVGSALAVPEVERLDEIEGSGPVLLTGPEIDPDEAPIGQVSEVAGRAVLDTFRIALGLADAGRARRDLLRPLQQAGDASGRSRPRGRA
jgi:4-hydroxythreonine-4-phosphate dehydrogenase